MRVLYDLIHARAAQNWHGPINSGNFNEYVKYWVTTARDLALELEAEELIDTAIAVNRIAAQQEKLCS